MAILKQIGVVTEHRPTAEYQQIKDIASAIELADQPQDEYIAAGPSRFSFNRYFSIRADTKFKNDINNSMVRLARGTAPHLVALRLKRSISLPGSSANIALYERLARLNANLIFYLQTMRPHTGMQISALGGDLAHKLENVWKYTSNEPLPADHDLREALSRGIPQIYLSRLASFLDALISDLPDRPVVCVAGHGHNPAVLLALLKRNVTIVSREGFGVQKWMLEKYPELRDAQKEGRLIISPFDREDHRTTYDVVFWEYPDPPRSGFKAEELPKGLKDGGYLVIQTGNPDEHARSFDNAPHWKKVFERPISPSDYLMPSKFLGIEGSVIVVLKSQLD